MAGPYGTNEGDIWLGGGEVQDRLDQDGEGLMVVHEMMMKDGRVQECLYVTANMELITAAAFGTERMVSEIASRN